MNSSSNSNWKAEAPVDLDAVFRLDGLNLTGMKAIFQDIYECLSRMGLKVEEADRKARSIPDFGEITNGVRGLQE